MHVSLFVLLLEIDVAEGVDDEDLAVLGHDSLLGARGPRARGCRCLGHGRRAAAAAGLLTDASGAGGAAGALPFLAGLLARLPLLHAALLAVQGDGGLLRLFVVGGGLRLRLRWRWLWVSSGSGVGGVESRDGEVVAPGGVSGELDVALDELALAPPAHVQGDVVEAAGADEQAAEEDGAEARAVAAVVVLGALPGGEAVLEEVVVAVAAGPAQDVGGDGEAGLALAGLLDGGLELGGAWGPGDLDALGLVLLGALGHDLLAHLVRV